MLPQRRPPTSSPPPHARETFTWPPSTEELDAIEVIVLDDPPAGPRPSPRRVDVAHWGLTLTSLLAIVVALALQLADWRGIRGGQQDAPDSAPAAVSAASSMLPVPPMPPAAAAPTAPPPRRAIVRPAAYVPVRKAPARERQSRTIVDSPPLRLPESYVQPRLVSTDDGGRVRGKVVLGVEVRANGRVGDVDVLSTDGDGRANLERAAVAAVKQWRYRPALRDGVPAPARLKVIVKFS